MSAAAEEISLPPNYGDILRARARRLIWMRQDPNRVVALKKYYRTHIDDFINDHGFTFDPRQVRLGLPVVMPFTLDQKQREWVRWTYQNWLDGEYGGTEKSRDVGCSWLAVAFCAALCVLYDNMDTGVGSFKKDKVDRRGDMGSLFEKARAFIELLPIEFRAGYRTDKDTADCRIYFPGTSSSIIGEIGDQIGRGARTGIYFVDEAAYLERDKGVDAALSKTTDCRQDISSVHGMLNSFAERMHDGMSRKFTFHWRDNPRFSQAQYNKFLQQWGPVITAQELDIDYLASVEGVLIPAIWVQAAIDLHIHLGIKITGSRIAALDVAEHGIDKNAFAVRRGVLLEHAESWRTGRNIGESVERAFSLSDRFSVDRIVYDAIGVGAGVDGIADKINDNRYKNKKMFESFRSSEKPKFPERLVPSTNVKNEDMFANAKAQGYWWLRYLFENAFRARNGEPYDADNLICIASGFAERAQALKELSQPTYTTNNAGKIVVDKDPDGTQSPNIADAIMMAFAPKKSAMVISSAALDLMGGRQAGMT
jgi:phage terminase large subunit